MEVQRQTWVSAREWYDWTQHYPRTRLAFGDLLRQYMSRPVRQERRTKSSRIHLTMRSGASGHHSTYNPISTRFLLRVIFGNGLPGQVRERCTVRVADNADGRLLLCVIEEHRILSSNSIHYSIRQGKCWFRPWGRCRRLYVEALGSVARVGCGRRRRRLHD
jgi:hypothetical protein